MKIHTIVWENRNDFDAILECEHCSGFQFMKYGYNDTRFHHQVIPAIQCMACGKRTNEIIPEGISDPGTQHGVRVHQVPVTVMQWQKLEGQQ